MTNQVIGVTIKGIGDFSDVVSNVGSVQKALTKLKLPDKLGDNLNKNIANFYKEYDKYQKKIAEGIHTQGDQNAVNKSLNSMLNSYEKIIKDLGKISTKDFKDIFNLDEGQFASVQKRIKDIEANMKKIKLDPKQLTEPLKVFQEATKAKSLFGGGKGFDRLDQAFKNNNLEEAKQAIIEIDNYLTRFGSRMDTTKLDKLQTAFAPLKQHVLNTDQATEEFTQDISKLNQVIAEIGERGVGEFNQFRNGLEDTENAAKSVVAELKQLHANEFDFNRQATDISRQIQQYFGLTQIIRKVGDIARDAFATVKELDKAMTETAVVTNFNVGDMWEMLPTYTAQANQLGSTIKDVYDAATLYYQQGLNTNQAMSLANETLKMARIAGLDAADATNMMTAALRGFNMEINQQSAQKINDIYSELAAITASDTKEIGSAMERTASIANSANMEFATTSAFLAQMIETTREAPENLGTAMKTIVARFQEMKKDPTKLIDSEGVAMDANKVDTALKSIGVQLMNTKGEFRDLDDVFLEIASKWDSLSQGQQRYIATIAAGSRQQSRFIAMMSNYERTMELVDAANNSAGASQRQFEKTLDSMEAKLNKLKNAWDQFTMGLMNNQILKFGVDALTTGFTVINKFIDFLGKIPPKPFEGVTKSLLTLVSTIGLLQFGGRGANAITGGVLSWLGGEGFSGGFGAGWNQPGNKNKVNNKNSNVINQGKIDGRNYGLAFNKSVITTIDNKSLLKTIGSSYAQLGKQAIGWDTIQANKIQLENSKIGQFQVGSLVHQLLPENAITAEATAQLQKCIDEAEGNVRLGLSNYKRQTGKGKFLDNNQAENIQKQYESLPTQKFDKGIDNNITKVEQFSTKISAAGKGLQDFGLLLTNTPLAPFGTLLSTIGSTIMTFGSAINFAADSFVLGMGKAVAAEGTAVTMTKLLGAGFKQLWLDMGPVGWVILGVIALAAAYKGLDAIIESNAEKLEKAEDAAAAASEAYDSAKQETSELADSITKIQETDAAFDGLVAGTAEFNEQLVTANEQIMALIDKYPMLLDASKNYVTTDDNGLMHISEAGFKAVKEYQKQIQANASAMNLIQTADLNALEHQQEADALRKKINGSRRGEMTEAEAKEHEKNLREADMLDQRADAEVKLARSNAIRTALAGKEIRDVDSLTSVYTNLYETKRKAAETEVAGLNKHDIRQQYADYHGYTYDRSTKKITDVEGNEVDYDDKVIKDEVIEQTVLLDFEANASTLESVLNEVDAKFADTLDSTSESSAHFISDVLANNINTDEDILEKALSGNDFQDAVNSMTEKEMAAILGINAESINEQNIDAKRNEIVDLLMNNATKIAEAQSKSYEGLATMMAQSKGWDTFDAEQKASQDLIRKEIQDLTAEQAHMMSDIGSQLKEGAGMEAMQIYMNRMGDLYKNINESGKQSDKDAAKEIEDIFNSVDLTSATGRLEAYTKMADSASDKVRELGEDMRTSAGEANLLGQAFDEFLGGDWLELAENADDFKNSLGQIDAAGILKASEQSHTLKTMLDSGETSASGLALALQGVEDGKFSIGAVNDSVLQLLSSLNRVEDEALKAHEIIANFDAGIDYGEGEDFVKENAEKAKEYYDNGEWGNQQLQNYIKLAAGQERWNEAVKEHHGDLEAVTQDLIGYVTTFKDGFQPAWDQMVAGQGINGKSLLENIDASDVSDELKDKFKQVQTYWDDDGFLNVDFANLTTDELELYYEKAYGVSKEYAQLLVQDLANYDGTISAMLSKNDLMAAIQTDSFKESHGTTTSGQTILTNQEIEILRQAGGEEVLEKVATDLGYAATEQTSAAQAMEEASFKVLDENGNRIDNTQDHGALLQDYIRTFGMAEKASIESLFKTGSEKLFTSGTLDLSKLIQDTQARGFDEQQAMQAAWQTYQRGEQLGERTSYEGVLLDKGIATYKEFTASIESALEASKWEAIGESIAQGIINFINSKDPGEKETERDANTSEKDAASAQVSREVQTELANKQADAIKGFFNKITTSLTTDSERARQGREQKTFGGMAQSTQATQSKESKSQASEQAAATLQEASNQISSSATNLTDAGSNLTKAGTDLSGAATKLASAALSLKTSSTTKKASASSSSNSGGGGKSGSGNIKINYTQGNLPTIKDTSAKLNYILGTQAKPKNQTAKVNYTLGTQEKPKDKTAKVNYNKAATGQNNYIPYRSPLQLGSLARGTRYGKLGPKGKGGLTLTGEEGFEIVWLPSESRSMILGANGPQMINLPSDAVVYTHEQSEDILRRRQEIEAGSHAKTGRRKSWNSSTSSKGSSKGSSSGSSGSSSSSSSSGSNEVHFSIEEVVRFNLDKKIEAMTSKIKKLTEEIDKNLKKIGTTALDITDSTQEQIKNLKSIKAFNDSLVASYQKDLNALDLQKYMMKVSYTDENGKSQDYSFDAQWYLYQSDGQYYINDSYIRQLSSPAQQKAVFDAVKGALDPLVSGLQKAKDAADDAQKQIEELADKLADAFYGWKNELTEIYDLTQRIKNETSFTDRFTSQIELDLSRLGAGLGKTSDAISNINAVLNRSNQTIRDQIENQKQLIDARKRELDNALSAQDELDKIEDYRNSEAYAGASDEEREAVIQKLTDEYDVAANALAYVTDVVRDLDGSVTYDIDWEGFEEANRQNPLNKETYDALKSYLDDLNSAATDFNGSVKDQTDLLKQTYDDLKKYQDTIVDFEGALLKGVEDQLKNETENAKNLSDSISNALKDLLDEVKRKLDERRKQEDNAKTERDIAQKQQRLAALRANTSGGNQVEIAQLEKEIADAQQSYGRTLEDQLLDRLQQQGDEAKLQRERQIELAEMSNEIGAANNKELVNLWLKNPELYKEQIKEAWLESQGYDEKGYAEQQSLLNQWDVEWTNLLTAIEQTGFNESTENIEKNTYTLIKLLADATGAVVDVTERNTETLKDLTLDLTGAQKAYSKGIDAETLKNLEFKAQDLLTAGYTPSQLAKAGYGIDKLVDAGVTDIDTLRSAGFGAKEIKQATGITDASAFKEAGFTAEDLLKADFGKEVVKDLFDAKALKEAGFKASELKDKFNISQLKDAGYTLPQLKEAFNASEFGAGGISYADAKKAGFTAQQLKNVAQYAKQAADELQPKVSQGPDLTYGSTGSGVTLLQKTLNKLGIRDNYGNALDTDGYFGQRTREAVINFQRKYKNKASRTLSADGVVGYYTKEAFRALGYKTGGLADYTGPAWLDGTPSKPELVLNPTDTKNFLALRDVLSSVMKSTSAVTNSYGGDIMYDINIHVDKIEKDYDVDRVVDKVKKEITKGAGYRNVTQVRNFR